MPGNYLGVLNCFKLLAGIPFNFGPLVLINEYEKVFLRHKIGNQIALIS